MLHQTTHLMYTSQKISCVNGSWWFVQMWLQLYMHQVVGINLNNRHFPSSGYKEVEIQITKGCQTYGEAASTISIDQNISQLFELFFRGFTNPLWLPYLNNDNLTLPYEFTFAPQHASNPSSPRAQTSFPQVETSASPRIQSSPSQVEAPVSPG
jgi:hypothetical protein